MNNILYDYLNKLFKTTGKTKIEELKPETQRVIAEWESTFNKPDISIKDIKELMRLTREGAIKSLKNPDIEYNSRVDIFHKSMIYLCDIVISFVDTPNQAKIELERHIRSITSRMK